MDFKIFRDKMQAHIDGESVDYDVNHESVIGFAKEKESFINRMTIL